MRNALLSLALVLVGSTAFADDTRTEVFDRTVNLRPGSEVEIENVNGRITIASWDQPRVRIHAVKKVRTSDDSTAQAALRALRVEVKQTSKGISIDTIYPKRDDATSLFGALFGGSINASVEYELTVPRQVNLNVDNTNGAIEVSDVTGELELETTNGRIQVVRCGGALDASTTNGAIDAELLAVTAGSEMSFETTNGRISLRMPRNAAAEINAGTTNGSIRSDLALATSRFSRTSLRGTLNGGGPEIRLRTTNGSIDIKAAGSAAR
jgi:DUF4097 and DUF4098 domain-containing protein YvlB